ncbi:MAG: rhomboid family intramembrane serine protease [Bacteroidetes bacterium]|nr:rhomboid family intramembrane serine protease [Bacteroidota bacterium]
MIPIGDDNSQHTLVPYVNYVLMALNILVFLVFQGFGQNYEFTYAYSCVPAEIITGRDIVSAAETIVDPNTGQTFQLPGLQTTPVHVWLTLITSIFMHGGWAHLGGNMLYLFIFGDNIENRLGHTKYFIFYMLVGLLASLSHVFSTFLMAQNTLIPSLGASGAISGVMGAYVLLFPNNMIRVFVFRFVTEVKALIALGFWIALQIVSGLGLLGGSESGGVAYAAHIGGFIAGLLLIKIFDTDYTNSSRIRQKNFRFYRRT